MSLLIVRGWRRKSDQSTVLLALVLGQISHTHTHTQAGGKPLHSPAVEITYGLERILMALQGVTNFKDIR